MALALKRLETTPGTLIQASDLQGTTLSAASKALSRLAQQGRIQRVRKGVYYVPKETLLGTSRPSGPAVAEKILAGRGRPTGVTAANLLGLTTQVPAQPEFAAYVTAPPRGIGSARLRIRPRDRAEALETRDAALLEFLRDRGRFGELDAQETCERIRAMLRAEEDPDPSGRLQRLRDVALTEPPRVRAILGALMETASLPEALWLPLKSSLNSLSRFDFGLFRELPNAKEWQAR